ncbi:phosphonate metabolism protein/1,5-bisphosphokinase (PRPP-forming) PhnN [Hydrogenophaga sp. PAMC20947]|uniref:phosphonate metabolism protein/1,5-bisphosphokinase (PRPP-forming) PhnN n=1 Tax=Hydrogenophaga sp. PAMC20947 TaxID=2565558 RepID=UPI00109DD273|nr:phosphonate metabolism protein/1,5-bisphosphokinase (PRPP-forming) PhnN [Hydrogenophaga sp. PAMC20947]QCB48460.1 phosphonate metabolism protein/1,5-bisphosphokinase (PRPP-forming) PhnN [Hydrogenophaga sp. PAMC20947]
MSQCLIYIIGPSGAGKDSVLHTLRQTWPGAAKAHWARRTITRPAQPGGEQHETVDVATFDRLRAQGAFGLHWEANELRYGVRANELAALDQGRCVFVNGSRGHLPTLLTQWPEATVVHISAPPHVLAQRLAARGREKLPAIAARLQREVSLALPSNHIAIQNDGPLQGAADTLAQRLNLQLRIETASAWVDTSPID